MTDSACAHNKTLSCKDCRLATLCLPLGFTRDELNQLDEVIQERPTLHKNDYLFKENEAFSSIYAVRAGCFKTITLNAAGEESTTGFFLPGDIIGIEGLGEHCYVNSAVAIETSSVCVIPFDHIEKLAAKLPDLQRQLYKLMSREMLIDQTITALLKINKAESRMAAFLLSWSARLQRQKLSATHYTLPMTRGDLASYLGLTIESVSRVLSRLHKENIINMDKRDLMINDIEKLQSIAAPKN